VCINPKSRTAAALSDPKFLSALKLAGHTVQTARVTGNAAEVLGGAGHYDIVLTDLSDAIAVDAVVARPGASASKPLVLPILYKPTKADATAAAGQFEVRLTIPERMPRVLGVIDDAMSARLKTGKAKSAVTE
jgi:hypothetical protein